VPYLPGLRTGVPATVSEALSRLQYEVALVSVTQGRDPTPPRDQVIYLFENTREKNDQGVHTYGVHTFGIFCLVLEG